VTVFVKEEWYRLQEALNKLLAGEFGICRAEGGREFFVLTPFSLWEKGWGRGA
jgi:hypothetical protein